MRIPDAPALAAALLEVSNLAVSFNTADGLVEAVRGVSFRVEPGRTSRLFSPRDQSGLIGLMAVAGFLWLQVWSTRRIGAEAEVESSELPA